MISPWKKKTISVTWIVLISWNLLELKYSDEQIPIIFAPSPSITKMSIFLFLNPIFKVDGKSEEKLAKSSSKYNLV